MITLLLVLVAGFFAASMHSVRVHYRKSLYNKWFSTKRNFFDEGISWKNKFKKGDRNKGSRFLFSTTFLSFTTDFYNLSNFLMILSLIVGMSFYTPIYGFWDIAINYLVFALSYEGFKKFLVS
jgi:hypothetical protein